MPQTGLIQNWQPASGDGVRIDDGIRVGQEVTPHYDPMLAKVIAYGKDRDEARRRLIRAVEDSILTGVHTNKNWLAAILKHENFTAGLSTTAFLSQFGDDESLQSVAPTLALQGLAALLLRKGSTSAAWNSNGQNRFACRLGLGGQKTALTLIHRDRTNWSVSAGEESADFTLHNADETSVVCTIDGVRQRFTFNLNNDELWLNTTTGCYRFEDHTHAPASAEDGEGSGEIRASMDGLIVDVLVAEGESVSRGQTIVVLEAMKMEHPLKAACDGVLAGLAVNSGDQVKGRQVLAIIDKAAV